MFSVCRQTDSNAVGLWFLCFSQRKFHPLLFSNLASTVTCALDWCFYSFVHSFTGTAAAAKLLQSCPTLCDPIDGSHQAPPSLGFSRQEHWSGLPFPSPMYESEKWKWSCSVVSDSSRPHGLQPTRLLHPWDFPGKVLEWGALPWRGMNGPGLCPHKGHLLPMGKRHVAKPSGIMTVRDICANGCTQAILPAPDFSNLCSLCRPLPLWQHTK